MTIVEFEYNGQTLKTYLGDALECGRIAMPWGEVVEIISWEPFKCETIYQFEGDPSTLNIQPDPESEWTPLMEIANEHEAVLTFR